MLSVISDTSPIRALAHLHLLAILPRLFKNIYVPPAVMKELTSPPAGMIRVDEHDLPFAVFSAPADKMRVEQLSQQLDRGEAEALSLAIELRADLVLIDERAGRSAAAKLGLNYTGTLGLLVRAKQLGIVDRLNPLLDSLQHELRFFISNQLQADILALVKE